jgi:hypothetical protein
VANPSAPDAYPKAIYESIMNMNGGNRLFEAAREFNTDYMAKRYMANEIKRLLSELNRK